MQAYVCDFMCEVACTAQADLMGNLLSSFSHESNPKSCHSRMKTCETGLHLPGSTPVSNMAITVPRPSNLGCSCIKEAESSQIV